MIQIKANSPSKASLENCVLKASFLILLGNPATRCLSLTIYGNEKSRAQRLILGDSVSILNMISSLAADASDCKDGFTDILLALIVPLYQSWIRLVWERRMWFSDR